MRMDRRRFVSTAAVGIVGASVSVRGSGQGVQGANDRITVGLIGCGGMGRSNLQNFMRMPDVQVVAVCDVYEFNRNRALKMTEGQKGAGPVAAVDDFRRVLDRKDIDAVIVATPDHWHAIPTILACEAGKDVYVEKPLSHNVVEGRKMVEAVEKHKRVLQMGTQQRSGAHFQEAVKLVRDGRSARSPAWRRGTTATSRRTAAATTRTRPRRRASTGTSTSGPAPKVPFNTNRFIWNFRWFWDYAGGMMTDWGVHLIDIAHWAMDVTAPLSVTAAGGKYVIQDNRDTPDTIQAVYEYPGFVLTYPTACSTPGPTTATATGSSSTGPTARCSSTAPVRIIPETSRRAGGAPAMARQGSRPGRGGTAAGVETAVEGAPAADVGRVRGDVGPEPQSHSQLPRLRQEPAEADLRRGDRPPLDRGLPPRQRVAAVRAEDQVERGDGDHRGRHRRRQVPHARGSRAPWKL